MKPSAISQLQCPICDHSMIHMKSMDTQVINSGRYKQGEVTFQLIGECLHKWDLVLGFHKGNVFLEARTTKTVTLPLKLEDGGWTT